MFHPNSDVATFEAKVIMPQLYIAAQSIPCYPFCITKKVIKMAFQDILEFLCHTGSRKSRNPEKKRVIELYWFGSYSNEMSYYQYTTATNHPIPTRRE